MSPRGVYARTRSVPTCHPDQKYAGNGLCRGCYRAKWRDEHREQLNSAEREKRRADPEKYRAIKREWSRRNREQVAAYARGRRAAHKEHVAHLRFGWRLSAFGLTRDEYQALLDRQDGRCAICREQPTGKRLSIDHNHACCSGNYSCGQCVRGLICDRCNRGIGYFRDNPNLMRIAAAYVERARVAQEGVA